MCGRFGLLATWEEIAAIYGLIGALPGGMRVVPPRYNIAPTQPVLAIRGPTTPDRGPDRGYEATFLRWGLVPSWAKDIDIGARMINARSETIAEKPAFRAAFRRRRCLIPASGFYEWQAPASGKGPKQPFWIARADGAPFSFAGLWEVWLSPDGSVLETCTIVTMAATEALAPIYPRMPVIIAPQDYESWLTVAPDGKESDTRAATNALRRPDVDDLVATPVGRLVNNVRNDGPDLIRPAEPGADLPPAPTRSARAIDSRQGSLF